MAFPSPGKSAITISRFRQPASGFAIVGVAARLSLNATGKIESAAIGVTGLGPKAYRAQAAEKALVGKRAGEKEIASAAKLAPRGIEPLGDLHASADYRREMAIVFTRRALEAAAAIAFGKAK